MTHKFVDNDKSDPKVFRRSLLHELCARHQSLLATNYPGVYGQNFIRKLHRDRPKLDITLVDKNVYPKPISGISRLRGDIFTLMLTGTQTLVDIDLYGGLPSFGIVNLERAKAWETLLITFAKVFRHRTLPPAITPGTDPALFMEEWCKKNGWKPPIMPDIGVRNPYRHPNKNAIMGLVDRRGPQYWTFLVQR